MLSLIILSVICALSVVHSNAVSSDQYWKTCSTKTDNFSECTKSAIEEAWPRIIAGFPEYKGPPLDPLEIEYVNVTDDYGIIRGTFELMNISIYGLSKSKLESWNLKLENGKLHLETTVYEPEIFWEAQHNYNYEILRISKNRAEGSFNESIIDFTMMLIIDGSIIDDRLVLQSVNMIANEPDQVKFWISDVYNGNKEITAALMLLGNSVWRIWYRVRPELVTVPVAGFIKDFLNSYFANIPVSKLVK